MIVVIVLMVKLFMPWKKTVTTSVKVFEICMICMQEILFCHRPISSEVTSNQSRICGKNRYDCLRCFSGEIFGLVTLLDTGLLGVSFAQSLVRSLCFGALGVSSRRSSELVVVTGLGSVSDNVITISQGTDFRTGNVQALVVTFECELDKLVVDGCASGETSSDFNLRPDSVCGLFRASPELSNGTDSKSGGLTNFLVELGVIGVDNRDSRKIGVYIVWVNEWTVGCGWATRSFGTETPSVSKNTLDPWNNHLRTDLLVEIAH
jgi:hypothetical protein